MEMFLLPLYIYVAITFPIHNCSYIMLMLLFHGIFFPVAMCKYRNALLSVYFVFDNVMIAISL